MVGVRLLRRKKKTLNRDLTGIVGIPATKKKSPPAAVLVGNSFETLIEQVSRKETCPYVLIPVQT